MYAITEISPWAFAIIHLGKGVENRSWYPPPYALGQRIAIHQGKKVDEDALYFLRRHHGGRPLIGELALGAVVGTALLKGFVCVRADGVSFTASQLTGEEAANAMASVWRAPGAKCLWVLTDPKPLRTPIYCRGMQGLWTVPPDVLEAMTTQALITGEAQP